MKCKCCNEKFKPLAIWDYYCKICHSKKAKELRSLKEV
jgi:Zn finger protein HypA/HybF involved in hydrogenase expression